MERIGVPAAARPVGPSDLPACTCCAGTRLCASKPLLRYHAPCCRPLGTCSSSANRAPLPLQPQPLLPLCAGSLGESSQASSSILCAAPLRLPAGRQTGDGSGASSQDAISGLHACEGGSRPLLCSSPGLEAGGGNQCTADGPPSGLRHACSPPEQLNTKQLLWEQP